MPQNGRVIEPTTTAPAQPASPPSKPGEPAPAPPAQDKNKGTPRSLRSWLLMALASTRVVAAALYMLRNVLLGASTPVYIATNAKLAQTVVASGRVVSPRQRIWIQSA